MQLNSVSPTQALTQTFTGSATLDELTAARESLKRMIRQGPPTR